MGRTERFHPNHSLLVACMLLFCGVMLTFIAGCSSGSSSIGETGKFIDSKTFGLDALFPCGETLTETAMTASGPHPIDVTVANDSDFLYVTLTALNGWGLEDVWVHASTDLQNGATRIASGFPPVSSFLHQNNRPDGTVVPEEIVAIPLADLGVQVGSDCGTTINVWAASRSRLLSQNQIIATAVSWGGVTDDPFSTPFANYIPYVLQCCTGDPDGGEFRTQSQGGWGTYCHGDNPGCYRDDWFDVNFPNGVTVGCTNGFTVHFTSSAAVRDFIPHGGKPAVLTQNHVDPTEKIDSGVLASQVLALALSLGFDAGDPDFGGGPDMLADQVICNTGTACDGMTVQQLFDEANIVLGGCTGTAGISPGELNTCLTMVNENFTDGVANLGFVCIQ